jgi:integrase
LTPYSFRHRYVRRGHELGIPIKHLATALGHSVESHLRAYSHFEAERDTDTAFAKALETGSDK